ncbi:hypothetical protein Len3610_15170 [Lentibacillus sp. CBA3610]|nr:hypothetical protein Len3610_15170 [Lentibacillus sp. CBA3610]
MRNQGPLSGNARDPGREQDQELLERNQQRQGRLQPEQNQPEQRNQLGQNQSQQGVSEYASQVIQLTNEERSQHGLSDLKASKPLSRVARNKSEDMHEKNYFSHTSPTYGSPFNMMKEFDVTFESAGENIARGQQSPNQVVEAWMDSDEHRENILDESFTHIGVGYTDDGRYWTQMLIEK